MNVTLEAINLTVAEASPLANVNVAVINPPIEAMSAVNPPKNAIAAP